MSQTTSNNVSPASSTARAKVVAVDGPAGSGKGTLAERLAVSLGFHLLDSGALYRIVGVMADRAGIAPEQADDLGELTRNLEIVFRPPADGVETIDGVTVLVGGEDLTAAIRTNAAGEAASRVAAVPEVRAALITTQRRMARPPGLVADGRDMGTVVFPDASLKIFLTATVEARAQRRYEQLKATGASVRIRDLLDSLRARDERDSTRAVAPLRPAEDAVVIDSTALSIDQVVARAQQLLQDRGIA